MRAVRDFVRRRPLGAFGAALIVLMLALAVFADAIARYDPYQVDMARLLRPPSAEFFLGTDPFGRDVFTRLVYGARTALLVGFSASLAGSTVGLVLGVVGAYFGGKVDQTIERLMDIVLSFPLIVLAIAVIAALGGGEGGAIQNVIIAIAVPIIPRVARVVRSSALALVHMPFIEAARSVGAGDARIIFRHMVPNVMAPYLIMLTAFLGQAILTEASLSFLGLGVTEPTPSWGLMLRGAGMQFLERAPWLAIAPGLVISAAVFGFNLFGDSLRDALDPRLRTA